MLWVNQLDFLLWLKSLTNFLCYDGQNKIWCHGGGPKVIVMVETVDYGVLVEGT